MSRTLSLAALACALVACVPATARAEQEKLALGVTIGGVVVGDLTPAAAEREVRRAYARPLVLDFKGRLIPISPGRLGTVAFVKRAVARARRAPALADVPLGIRPSKGHIRRWVAGLARRLDRAPVDATLTLRGVTPKLVPERPGRAIDQRAAVRDIVRVLEANVRPRIKLSVRKLAPAVTRATYGTVIVIRRSSNRLYFYRGERLERSFGVATGQAEYPTPLGRFSIVVKWRHPWWYPPDSDWAKGQEPVPPGPNNPLGTRWMGLSVSGVGIHGTPNAASIGYSASHGCIRMVISEAEWLFERVSIGTPVFIVAA